MSQYVEVVSDMMKITKIVTSLPSTYSHCITAWESVPIAEQTKDNLVGKLLNEEDRRQPEAMSEGDQVKALVSKQQAKVVCFNCGV